MQGLLHRWAKREGGSLSWGAVPAPGTRAQSSNRKQWIYWAEQQYLLQVPVHSLATENNGINWAKQQYLLQVSVHSLATENNGINWAEQQYLLQVPVHSLAT